MGKNNLICFEQSPRLMKRIHYPHNRNDGWKIRISLPRFGIDWIEKIIIVQQLFLVSSPRRRSARQASASWQAKISFVIYFCNSNLLPMILTCYTSPPRRFSPRMQHQNSKNQTLGFEIGLRKEEKPKTIIIPHLYEIG
jgi:hypothetical protein